MIRVMFFILAATCPAAVAAPTLQYFAWTAHGANAFDSTAGGVGGTLSFSTTGDDQLVRYDELTTASTFVAAYGSSVPTMKVNSGVAGSEASALSAISFDGPLPTGSQLIVFDVDTSPRNERVQLSRAGGNLTLIDQLESQTGAKSLFPTWSAASGTLQAQGNGDNDAEATVFDVAGVQSLTVRYLRDAGGTGVTGALFAIGVPVPEATFGTLLAPALLWASRWRRGRGRSRLASSAPSWVNRDPSGGGSGSTFYDSVSTAPR